MVRQLQPWHENLKKRQVKSPKVYIRDTGLLHQLLGIRSMSELLSHPKCGASWEGYVVEEVISSIQPDEAYFWATHAGAELDLLLVKDGRRPAPHPFHDDRSQGLMPGPAAGCVSRRTPLFTVRTGRSNTPSRAFSPSHLNNHGAKPSWRHFCSTEPRAQGLSCQHVLSRHPGSAGGFRPGGCPNDDQNGGRLVP